MARQAAIVGATSADQRQVVRISHVSSTETILNCLELRYRVYRGLCYIPPDPDGLDVDRYDEFAFHLAATDGESQVVGTARLIAPGTVQESAVTELLRGLAAVRDVSDDSVRPQLPLFDADNHDIESSDEHPLCELSRVIVEPRFRRRGIATGLIQSALAVAARIGSEVIVECLKEHEPCYLRHGFARMATGVRSASLTMPGDLVVLRRSVYPRVSVSAEDCVVDRFAQL